MIGRLRWWVASGVVAAALAAWLMSGDQVDPAAAPAGVQAAVPATAAAALVADVRLELLDAEPAALSEAERNPFEFQARRAPAAPSVTAGPRPGPIAMPGPPVPSGPPSPAPIPLRFIGLVDAPTQAGRVAILSDGRGNVFQGKEGDIIEGRYRLLKITEDAAELAHLDGRGRQTIRLSGQ